MAGRLDGKVAIVTGASQGIGAAVARRFAAEGCRVLAGDIQPVAFDGVTGVRLDVSDESDWAAVAQQALQTWGRIDILVNNAGIIGSYDGVADIDLAIWRRVIDVNQTGPLLGMRAVLPAMRAAGRGSIVNVSSIWGSVGAPGLAAYTATEGAIRNLTKSAALFHAREGIRVNSVHPGLIATPLTAAQSEEQNDAITADTPMGRFGTPEEIAAGCLFLASDDASFVTGSELVIDGGYLAR
ncbi:SDR family NAD(P)-dependent oxidoreductase [Sphingomonas sp. Leaf25]|uniref:SDR family NAD(P)-dependent oxidoreductase n=1 Tax=Sphingomonas sp. Leaf25 TaxID=1735692 RepID=UPI0006FCCA4C|nr:SDR family oxidoreductase [Sphingomonas sp. Leaf25]KQM99395.1 hypothetical protein ASE78_17955 [Sphingomonas sp. Leaf25]